jgi:hypothetical protein
MCSIIKNRISIPISTIRSPSSYFTEKIPVDLLLILAEYAGTSIINLASTSSSMMKNFDDVAEYFLQVRYERLRPLDTTDLTSMILMMSPMYFRKWGEYKSTIEKETMFCDAVRRGDISALNHIMSLGVDVDARRLCFENIDESIAGNALYPVQEAASFNQPKSLEFLFNYGANVNPMCNISKRWFISGPTDLFEYRSRARFWVSDCSEVTKLIIAEHIKVGDFSIFHNNYWRSDEGLFPWFCEALARIPRGTLSGYCANCDKCKAFSSDIAFGNGRMLCETCVASPVEVLDYSKLWVDPPIISIHIDVDELIFGDDDDYVIDEETHVSDYGLDPSDVDELIFGDDDDYVIDEETHVSDYGLDPSDTDTDIDEMW